ncbi:MAG: hypothetical protein ABI359_05025 [Ginsengibacter sp.]
MQAIKHILTPESKEISIILPDNFVHEELEIIILPVRDIEKISEKNQYKSQRGKLSKVEAEKMLSYVEQSRKEWQ